MFNPEAAGRHSAATSFRANAVDGVDRERFCGDLPLLPAERDSFAVDSLQNTRLDALLLEDSRAPLRFGRSLRKRPVRDGGREWAARGGSTRWSLQQCAPLNGRFFFVLAGFWQPVDQRTITLLVGLFFCIGVFVPIALVSVDFVYRYRVLCR